MKMISLNLGHPDSNANANSVESWPKVEKRLALGVSYFSIFRFGVDRRSLKGTDSDPGGPEMKRKSYFEENIISILKEHEAGGPIFLWQESNLEADHVNFMALSCK